MAGSSWHACVLMYTRISKLDAHFMYCRVCRNVIQFDYFTKFLYALYRTSSVKQVNRKQSSLPFFFLSCFHFRL